MGRSFESYALRKAALEPVRSAVDAWLRERGMEPSQARAPDALRPQDSCRVILFHNPEWTVVLPSHPFQQGGDSIESALVRLNSPLLKTWVYDSDLWGYELRVDGQLRASFNSNPKYFGVATDQPLPKNGDPEELAAALSMPDLARRVREIQGGMSLFAEFRAEKLAAALKALPLALETDMVPAHLREDATLKAGGFQVIALDYAKPRSAMRLVDLHLDYSPGAGGRYSFNDVPAMDPETMRQIEQTQRLFRAVGWVFKPVFWLAGMVLRPVFKAAAAGAIGEMTQGRGGEELTRLMTDLQALAVPTMRQEGPWIVNPHLGYRVRGQMTPGSAEVGAPGLIFCFQLLGSNVNCTLMPPEQARMMLSTLTARGGDDVKHFVGDFQARTLYTTMAPPMNLTSAQTLIRLDDALLLFAGSFKDTDPKALRKTWEDMIDSFEVKPR